MTETQMFCKPLEVPTRAENEPACKILSNWQLYIFTINHKWLAIIG